MRVIAMIKATPASEAGEPPSPRLLEDMARYNAELVRAGVMLAGEGLHPSRRGVRLHFEGGAPRVTDGPFAHTRELLAGFWLWQVRSIEEAIEWARRCPNPHHEPCEIEIRPVLEADEFSDESSPRAA